MHTLSHSPERIHQSNIPGRAPGHAYTHQDAFTKTLTRTCSPRHILTRLCTRTYIHALPRHIYILNRSCTRTYVHSPGCIHQDIFYICLPGHAYTHQDVLTMTNIYLPGRAPGRIHQDIRIIYLPRRAPGHTFTKT